jgi:predicted nucleic acid-binding protein
VIAAFHRKFREGMVSQPVFTPLLKQFETDNAANGIEWLPLNGNVLARAGRCYAALPATVYLRAADALHLACAAEAEFREVYSNDAQFLGGAQFFGLKGVNII